MMTGAFSPKVVAPGGLEGYFEKLAPILADHRTPPEYYQLAEDYGITIQDDWVKRAGTGLRRQALTGPP
jgi:hypothetical protein